nr:DUF2326 domain-containing protein [Candidatus Accumulibacter sp. ACC012]
MHVFDERAEGPVFWFAMQGSRSKGIKNLQPFSCDSMLMRLCHWRGLGADFLVYGSHPLDDVGGRQVIKSLRAGERPRSDLGFQCSVTMSDDDPCKKSEGEFVLGKHVLMDATEEGGLFGVRSLTEACF